MQTSDSEGGPGGSLRSETRDRLLDTAREQFTEHGVEGTSISRIIVASGHGRTTFYRYFNGLDDVLTQLVMRDFEQLIHDFRQQRFNHEDPAVQIIEDMSWFFRQMRVRPGVNLLFRDRDPLLHRRIGPAIDAFRDAAASLSRPIWDAASATGRLREGVTLEAYVEWVSFALVSMLSNPFPFTGDEFLLRDALRNFFVPSLINDRP